MQRDAEKAAGELKELEGAGQHFLDSYFIGGVKAEELQTHDGTNEKWTSDLSKRLLIYAVVLILIITLAAKAFGAVVVVGIDLSGSSKTSHLEKNKRKK